MAKLGKSCFTTDMDGSLSFVYDILVMRKRTCYDFSSLDLIYMKALHLTVLQRYMLWDYSDE